MCAGGELFAEVVCCQGLSEARARLYFRQILLGLAYCHGRQLAHRDLKLENLLLSHDKRELKIADFGLAKAQNATTKTIIGTVKFMAPEQFAGTAYDAYKSDIWAAGAFAYHP